MITGGQIITILGKMINESGRYLSAVRVSQELGIGWNRAAQALTILNQGNEELLSAVLTKQLTIYGAYKLIKQNAPKKLADDSHDRSIHDLTVINMFIAEHITEIVQKGNARNWIKELRRCRRELTRNIKRIERERP